MLYPQRIIELDESSRYLVVARLEIENYRPPIEAVERLRSQIETAIAKLLGARVAAIMTDNVNLDLDFTQFKPEVNHD